MFGTSFTIVMVLLAIGFSIWMLNIAEELKKWDKKN